MREYITTKAFYSGDFDKYVLEKEQIKFDGNKALFRGEEHKAPNLQSAIKVGWMIPVTTDARGKVVADADPATIETPEQRAKRLRAERLQKVNGSAGAGEFIEEHAARINKAKKVAAVKPKREEDTEVKKARQVIESDGVELTHPDLKKKAAAPEPAPKKVHTVLNEMDGEEIKKINVASHSESEDESPASFYEAIKSGEKKSLPIARDQYVAKKVDNDEYNIKATVSSGGSDASDLQEMISQADAIVINRKGPTKDWSSMTANKKQAFIKKQTDNAVLKQIISQETGVVKRKAQERLSEIEPNERQGL